MRLYRPSADSQWLIFLRTGLYYSFFNHSFNLKFIMKTVSLPTLPPAEKLARLTQVADALVKRSKQQMGYPFDQEVNLKAFYEYLVKTGLCDVTLINVGDPYKTEWDMLNSDEFERAAIDFFAESFHFENTHWGVLTNGGTDGNMHGIYFGRKALAAKSPLPPILYVSEEAHYSVKKMGDIQNLETRIIPAAPAGQMLTEELRKQLDPKRPALIAIAIGGTFKGAIDDQRAIARVIEEVKPVACYRHLDVALFGGYLPYLEEESARHIVDVQQMGFDSLALSGHKFVGLNEPAGIFICRKSVLDSLNSTPVPYLNGVIPTINCSRSGFDALKLYWKIATTGREGFQAQARHIMRMTAMLKDELSKHGVKPLVNPWSNTVCMPRPSDRVIHKYCMACNECRHYGKLAHVVVMQYFTPELIQQLVKDVIELK